MSIVIIMFAGALGAGFAAFSDHANLPAHQGATQQFEAQGKHITEIKADVKALEETVNEQAIEQAVQGADITEIKADVKTILRRNEP